MNQPYQEAAPASSQRYGLRALGFAPVFALFVAALVFGWWASVQPLRTTFPGFFVWSNGYLVALHASSWEGAKAGLPLNGGRITHVEGEAVQEVDAFLRRLRTEAPGRAIVYTIESGGGSREYRVPSAVFRLSDHLKTLSVYWGSAAAFFLIAAIALLLQPGEGGARALALASAWMGLSLCFAIDYVVTHRAIGLYLITEAMTPSALWYFAFRFPIRHSSALSRSVLVASTALGLLLFALAWSGYYEAAERSRVIARIHGVLIGIAGIGVGVQFFRAFWAARTPRVRRQAAVVLAAGLLAISVPGLAVVGFYMLGWDLSFAWIVLPLPIFPAAILYSIVRQDLLAVERFARLTTGYVLATGAFALSYALVIFAAERGLDPGASTHPFFALALLLGFAVLFEPLRRRVQGAVDHAFYRSEVATGVALEQTGFEIAQARSEESAVGIVVGRARDFLRVDWVRYAPAEDAGSEEAALRAPVRFRDETSGFLECGAKKSGAPFSDPERELLRGLASQLALGLETARSIQELQRAQELLVRSERLAAIGEFAGSMAHGIRNPLAGIRATAELGAEEPGAPRETLLAIVRDVDRLEHRIQTLLDFSRPFEPELRPADLANVLQSVADTYRPRSLRDGVRINLELPHPAVWALVDPDYLEEALLELVANAFTALEGAGTISLSAGSGETGEGWIRVADTGAGIPDGVRGRIFELFFTTRDQGTGLGLATVRKTISRMGGSIEIEDSGPSGTRFKIRLPGASPVVD